jgi:hypothetical protein
MRTPRLAGVGLGMLAAVALGMAGCDPDATATPGASTAASDAASAAPSPAVSGSADPAAASALATATAALGTQSFKITMTAGPGVKLTGLIDSPDSKGTATLNITGSNTDIQVKTLLVVQDLYVQIPGVTKTGKWTHVDVSKLPEGANTGLRPGQIDPINTQKVLTSTTDVKQVDSRSYSGTLDLTKVAGITGIDPATVTTWGAAAKNVPFTAGLDDQGRLSALTIQLPAVQGQKAEPLDVTYTDYGTPVTADRPATVDVVEAPASLYSALGG